MNSSRARRLSGASARKSAHVSRFWRKERAGRAGRAKSRAWPPTAPLGMATYCTTLFQMSSSRVSTHDPATPERSDFIREIVAADVREGRVSEVVTRFPPEPNGYLHIGHPKAIALNFGIAQEFGGRSHLRFDDTNPIKEEQEYIDSIQEDIRRLGFDW